MGYFEQYQQQASFNKWYIEMLSICAEMDKTNRMVTGTVVDTGAGKLAPQTARIRLQNAVVIMKSLEGRL